jgi:hypothetical protein
MARGADAAHGGNAAGSVSIELGQAPRSGQDQLQWIHLLEDALKFFEIGKTKLWQIHDKRKAQGTLTFDALMEDFTQVYDQHALDHLWHEWNNLRQGAKETVSDFQTRFEEIIEALEDHNFSIPEGTLHAFQK